MVDEPTELPEGTELLIPLPEGDDGAPSPEEIARTLAAMDRFEPLAMSPEEWSAWEANRAARKAAEKSAFFDHAERLRSMWDGPVSPR